MFWLPLAIITLVQLVAALSILSLPPVISEITGSVDAGSRLVGLQTSVIFACGVVTAFFGGTVVNILGPGRTSQACMLVVMLAVAVCLTGEAAGFIVAGILLGLAYGLSHPPGTTVVQIIAPAHLRTIGFGIRQTAVPLGGALASLALPPIATTFGWRWAFVFVAGMAFLALALVQPFERHWRVTGESRVTSMAGIFRNIRAASKKKNFGKFAVTSAIFGAGQFTVAPFAILYYQHDLGFSLIDAGVLSATIHGSAIASRLMWSWLADRTDEPRLVLLVITFLMIPATTTMLLMTAETSLPVVYIHAALLGATVLGWNGVFMAEVVRGSPPAEIAQVTGLIVAIFAIGASAGPLAFMQIFSVAGSFAAAFAALGLLLLIPLTMIFLTRR